ncbi:magnesium chelatase subunit H [Roseiflexus sp.]|uniref:magnesium chelatase subunit H n=1 Tax=Roseiflexus sp. TaxID=2562120 RepID=UPI00398AB375
MKTLTFILGMERFNAHIWEEVERNLRQSGVAVRLLRFHDGHVEQRDPALVDAIRQADVLFITLINMREQAEWLKAQIDQAGVATVFAFESMPEVMALTRVGEYRVQNSGRASMPKPMQAVLRLMTRGREEDTLYAYTKLTKLTAKLLPLMPPKLKDFRTWLSVNIYWNQPDVYNLTQMVRLILRDCLGQNLDVAPVRMIPTMGCFHPATDEFFSNPDAYLKWYRKFRNQKKRSTLPPDAPLVALLAFRKHIVQRQQYVADLIEALEAQGMAVLPIVVSGIEMHVAVREWVARQKVDLIINTMGFPIIGGPAGSTKPGQYRDTAINLLAGIDAPYMVVQPLQMQDIDHWRSHGVAPMQAVIMYDLPEMDGSVAPVALGAIQEQRIVATPDRLARAARLAAGWVRLRRKANTEKRVALVIYNFPPGMGKLGTAALLDVPATLHTILKRLAAEGYRVEGIPATVEELAQQIATLDTAEDAQTVVASRTAVPLTEYHAIVPATHAERIDRKWGAPPGEIAPQGRDAIRLDTLSFGNVIVAVQPPMGVPGDPMRLLFDRDFTPHHQYVAFYRWLTQRWRADAIVHVGMHGTAEWMPGLQLGLTDDCWPDLLLGEAPHIYLYPLNNPAEAAIARRRGYAAIISHLTPPYARAGLYRQLAMVRAEVEELEIHRTTDNAQALYEQFPLLRTHFPELAPHDGEPSDVFLQRVRQHLDEIEQRLILDGLHVFGTAPAPDRAAALIESALDVPREGRLGLSGALRGIGVPDDRVTQARADFVRRFIIERQTIHLTDWLQEFGRSPDIGVLFDLQFYIDHGRAMLDGLAQAPGELDALMHALNGGYIRPAPGADPVRAGAAALPSGRNIHSIDPWRLPSDAALERGRLMANQLLEQHRLSSPQGAYPKTVALTLWALDTIKTEGESIGAALALVGARPERDGQGKIWRYELVPLEELGRPRIDVLLDVSAIFRDTFQISLDLLDDLFRRAAEADEPLRQNFIRAHALEHQARGLSWEQATARIFTQAPGRYGTGVDELVEEGQWLETSDLADMYIRRNGFAYGGGRSGQEAAEVLRGMLGTVEHVFQAIDSVEYGLTDMQHYYGHSGAIRLAAERARGGDVPLSYAESHTGHVRIAPVEQLIRLEARAKLLNPRWYEALLQHGYAGAAEIGNRFTYLVGWSATASAVEKWVYDQMAETFVLDEAMRERLAQANPRAARNAVARLLESHGRGLWQADDETIERLQTIYADLEDRLEGVIQA